MLDTFIAHFDRALKSVFPSDDLIAGQDCRPSPAQDLKEPRLNHKERRLVSGLMRINHAGEICAQGLYHGQSVTARLPTVRQQMEQAAEEEIDHLVWCRQRLQELGSRTSYLDPLWYLGSFMIGAGSGLLGDQWSLGFVAETERQVALHLEGHEDRIPKHDIKTQAVLRTMRDEELKHREMALQAGGMHFLKPVQSLMRWTSKAMTTLTYWI